MHAPKPLLLASAAVAFALGLAGCATTATDPAATDAAESSSVDLVAVTAADITTTIVTTDDWSEADAVDVDLAAETVRIEEAGVYRLSGALAGQVVVDAGDDAQVVLILDGVEIDSSTTAAIAVVSAGAVAIHVADGTENRLGDADAYDEDAEISAAIYSVADLTITGDGVLEVVGGADDGIKLDGAGFVQLGGRLAVTAPEDAVDADGDILVSGGSIEIAADDDGIHSEATLVIDGGEVTVTESEEALEGLWIGIDGGVIDVTSNDDGLNASGGTGSAASAAREGESTDGYADVAERLSISGGELTVDAEGDGIDSNGSLLIAGGATVINGPTGSDNGALDADGDFLITGGTVVALSSGGMDLTPGDASTQGWVYATVDGEAGTTVGVEGAAEAEARKAYGAVFVSAPEIVDGEEVDIVIDGESAATAVAGEGGSGGMGGMGGMGGGPGQGGEGGNMPGAGGEGGEGDGVRPSGMPDGMPDGMPEGFPTDMPQQEDAATTPDA